MGLDKSN